MPSIYSYVRKGTVSLFPENLHLIFESSFNSTYCYFVNSANKKQLIKMNMTDRTTSVVETRTNKDIARGFIDRNTDEIYFIDSDYDQSTSYVWKIDLSDDSVTELTSKGVTDIFDIWRYSSKTYILYSEYTYVGPDPFEVLVDIEDIDSPLTFTTNMGQFAGKSWKISQITLIGDKVWFLFKWSSENVELWKGDIGGVSFTKMEDFGATTELPIIEQGAIAYDGSNILYSIIGKGTAEVSTIVADTQANITDETYFTIYVIKLDYENVRSEWSINCWFDKAGDSTWTADPADADENIQIDISGDVSAQDVSDTITAAIEAHELVGATNGGGTSTTVTITNHYNGNTTNINARNSGLSVATSTPGVVNTYYLYTYAISTDTLTDTTLAYDLALMLDRNTNSSATPECFALEKGFIRTITADYKAKVHQIARVRGALNILGQITLAAGGYIIAITDNYLFAYDGTNYYLWQYQDIMSTQIALCKPHAKKRTWYTIELQWLDLGTAYQDPPTRDQFIQVFGTYSSYTLGGTYTETNHIIAEGLVRIHDLKLTRNVTVESLVKEELRNISPNISDYTNYTGKTSGQIISQLITDYCKTIVAGTISNGATTWTCPDDWKAQGDKSLEQIFNEFADTEEFQWYLRPDNSLDFNDGTVDSQRTFATTDVYSNPEAKQLSQNINQIELMGGFVDGTQIGPVTSDDLEHQQLYGNIVKWSKTYASVLDATILQTLADAKLNLQGSAPLVYWATRRVSTDWGFIQVGELITMQAVRVDPDSDQTLPTGDYILDENTYDAKEGESDLKLTDGLLFQEDASMNLPEQNSQLIQQTASTLREIARPDASGLSPDHTAEGCVVTLTAGENLVFGEVCYFKSDGKCWKADSSATTTMPVSFMALESITADNTGSFLLWGTVRDDTWNWTVGGLIYISSTAGALSQTAPAGEEIQVCGIALSADIMLLFPNFQYGSDVVFAASWNSLYQFATKNAIYDKLNSLYCMDHIPMYPSSETDFSLGAIRCNSVGEICYVSFYVNPDIVDTDGDIVFTFTHQCTSSDAAVDFKKYVSAVKTDGSEAYHNYNISNGVAITLDSTVADRLYKYELTISTGDYDAEDTIDIGLYLNEGSRTIIFTSCSVYYKVKIV